MSPGCPHNGGLMHRYKMVVGWAIQTANQDFGVSTSTQRAVEVMCSCGHIETIEKLKGGDKK
jgi:poly(3-hydroxybutyrate) depolymerase